MFESEDLTPLTDEPGSAQAYRKVMKEEYDKKLGLCGLRDPEGNATMCCRSPGHTGPHVNFWIVWSDNYNEKLW